MRFIWNALRLTVTPFFVAGLLLYFGFAICSCANVSATEVPPPAEPPPAEVTWGPDPDTANFSVDEPPTNFINQAAVQNKDIVIQNVENLLCDSFRTYDEAYMARHTFGGNDLFETLLANLGQLIFKWLNEFCGWLHESQFIHVKLSVIIVLCIERLIPLRRRPSSATSTFISGLRLGIYMGIAGVLVSAL